MNTYLFICTFNQHQH